MQDTLSEEHDRLSRGHVTADAMFGSDSTELTIIPSDALVLIFLGITNLQPAVFELDWHWGPSQSKLGTNREPNCKSSLMETLTIEDCAA
ncbi:MAG: hypothetical protein WB421_07920 [Terriglobales bacterium]|jgi:hypothetical protein